MGNGATLVRVWVVWLRFHLENFVPGYGCATADETEFIIPSIVLTQHHGDHLSIANNVFDFCWLVFFSSLCIVTLLNLDKDVLSLDTLEIWKPFPYVLWN